jgi:hypothetical protein
LFTDFPVQPGQIARIEDKLHGGSVAVLFAPHGAPVLGTDLFHIRQCLPRTAQFAGRIGKNLTRRFLLMLTVRQYGFQFKRSRHRSHSP